MLVYMMYSLLLLLSLVVPAYGTTVMPGSGAVPSSAGILMASGSTCPSGYTRVTAANGFYLVGAPTSQAAAATVGSAITNPIADTSFTPLGSNSTPTFTGSALATHQHRAPLDASSGGSVMYSAAFGSGTDNINWTYGATGLVAGQPAGAGYPPSLVEGTSGGTPAGTVTAPTFTGTANAVMRSTHAPPFTVILCTKN